MDRVWSAVVWDIHHQERRVSRSTFGVCNWCMVLKQETETWILMPERYARCCFDYNVPIPVEKASKKVQMERYRPCQNSLEARQFDSVMLRDNELKITWHLRQAISLSAKSRCLVTQCNHCANPTTLNQVRTCSESSAGVKIVLFELFLLKLSR